MKLQTLKSAITDLSVQDKKELVKFIKSSLPKKKSFSIRRAFTTAQQANQVSRLRIHALRKEVLKQIKLGGTINFDVALNVAIDNLLTDGRDIESPFGLVKELCEDFGLKRENLTNEQIIEVIRGYMNDGNATLELMTSESRFPPENGESMDKYWIFLFKNNRFSSSLHWVLVDRNGEQAAFNYGFG